MEKKCFKCEKIKPLSNYYVHKKMADGHLGKCKECTKLDVRKRESKLIENPEWIKSERKRHRDKYFRLEYKEKHKSTSKEANEAMEKYREKFPEKYKANSSSQRISSKLGHNHHWSYNKDHWKDVIDINPKNHLKAHRFLIYDQERMMYRGLDFVLLDTKKKHLDYIINKIKTEED